MIFRVVNDGRAFQTLIPATKHISMKSKYQMHNRDGIRSKIMIISIVLLTIRVYPVSTMPTVYRIPMEISYFEIHYKNKGSDL